MKETNKRAENKWINQCTNEWNHEEWKAIINDNAKVMQISGLGFPYHNYGSCGFEMRDNVLRHYVVDSSWL